jgi:putative DNA-invertase from lambdoid prophage Rac
LARTRGDSHAENLDHRKEIASGAKQERAERKKILALAQARKVDVILVTELIRWGR